MSFQRHVRAFPAPGRDGTPREKHLHQLGADPLVAPGIPSAIGLVLAAVGRARTLRSPPLTGSRALSACPELVEVDPIELVPKPGNFSIEVAGGSRTGVGRVVAVGARK